MFRLVRSDALRPEDFRTHAKLGRLPAAPPCLRHGLSLFRDRLDAEHQRRLFPGLGRFLARGLLQPGDGRTQLTRGQRPSHTTWWPFPSVDRLRPFAAQPPVELP